MKPALTCAVAIALGLGMGCRGEAPDAADPPPRATAPPAAGAPLGADAGGRADRADTAPEAPRRDRAAISTIVARTLATLDGRLEVEVGQIRFARDGSAVAYPAELARKHLVVTGDARGPVFDEVGRTVALGPGGRVAYRARQGNDHLVVLDGAPGPAFRAVADPILSPDGRRVAYAARTPEGWRMHLDGALAGDPAPRLGAPAFDATSARVAWPEWRADGRVQVGDGPVYDAVIGPVFRPDGALVYAGLVAGGWEVVVDGAPQAVAFQPSFPPVFSADGAHSAWVASGRPGTWLVVDGQPQAPHAGIGRVALTDAGQVLYAARSEPSGPWRILPREAAGAGYHEVRSLRPAGGRVISVVRVTAEDPFEVRLDGRSLGRWRHVGAVRTGGGRLSFGALDGTALQWVSLPLAAP